MGEGKKKGGGEGGRIEKGRKERGRRNPSLFPLKCVVVSTGKYRVVSLLAKLTRSYYLPCAHCFDP